MYGMYVMVSLIYVNGWFGKYDKLSVSVLFVCCVFGLDLYVECDCWVFVGDFVNDVVMFEFFLFLVGVVNVLDVIDMLFVLFIYFIEVEGGGGFVEVVECILEVCFLVLFVLCD